MLPFGIPRDEWDYVSAGDGWTIYGDGQIQDEFGNSIPGNWGTLDIGAISN